MSLYRDPDAWLARPWNVPPAVTPPAPPADPRRQQLLDLAAVDLLVNVIRITGGLSDAQALLDLLGATKNLGDLVDGADPAQMLGEDYAGPNGADLAREAMLAAQKDALDRLLGGAP